jgi:hypothetical protein
MSGSGEGLVMQFIVGGLLGVSINCGGLLLEKGEEGGGESPWFYAKVLGGRRWSAGMFDRRILLIKWEVGLDCVVGWEIDGLEWGLVLGSNIKGPFVCNFKTPQGPKL